MIRDVFEPFDLNHICFCFWLPNHFHFPFSLMIGEPLKGDFLSLIVINPAKWALSPWNSNPVVDTLQDVIIKIYLFHKPLTSALPFPGRWQGLCPCRPVDLAHRTVSP